MAVTLTLLALMTALLAGSWPASHVQADNPASHPLTGHVLTESGEAFGAEGVLEIETVDVMAGTVVLQGKFDGTISSPNGTVPSWEERLILAVVGVNGADPCDALIVDLSNLVQNVVGMSLDATEGVVALTRETEAQTSLDELLCQLGRVFEEGSSMSVNELVPAVNRLLR